MKPLPIFVKEHKHREIVELNIGKNKYLVKMLKLLRYVEGSPLSRENELLSENTTLLERITKVLSRRANGTSYIVVTIIDKNNVSTYLVLASKNLTADELDREAEIVKEVIETLSGGEVSAVIEKKLSRRIIVVPLSSSLAKKGGSVIELHQLEIAPRSDISSPFIKAAYNDHGIYLGRVHTEDTEGAPFYIPRDAVFRHIAVFGTTGSGKTTTSAVLSANLVCDNFTVFVLDWHGEYNSKLNRYPKIVIDLAQGDYLTNLAIEDLVLKDPQGFVEILDTSLDLTPAQSYILSKILERYNGEESVWEYLAKSLKNSHFGEAAWERESRLALYRKLRHLLYMPPRKQNFTLPEEPVIAIIDLSRITNTRVKRVYAHLIIKTIAFYIQHGKLRRDTVIVVDEAHNIFDKDSPIAFLISEVRKWRLGFVISTQSPSFVSTNVMKNTNTKIIHTLKSSIDLSTLSRSLYIPREIEEKIPFLPPGRAVVALSEIEWPAIVDVDAGVLEKGCVKAT
ncbi:MAG: hypothetical protein DRO12_04340 [Thermoprotei archaeon]|nr:MAG: hypothetical protein DRO12_04340 [Thermoprotei archaeon]